MYNLKKKETLCLIYLYYYKRLTCWGFFFPFDFQVIKMTLLHYSIFMDLRSVLLGIAIVLVMFWWFRQPRHKNLPPGPINWPIVGTLLGMVVAKLRTGDHPRKILQRMSHTYGKVFCIYIGSQRIVVLNGYECIKEAFQNPLLLDRVKPNKDPTDKGQGKV